MSEKTKIVTPHWIMRLLGARAATFELASNGLRVTTSTGERHVVLTESLASGVNCIDGIIFSKLVLNTDNGRKKFGGLRKKDASIIFPWLQQHWIEQLTPSVTETAHQIKAILNKGYLRRSRLPKVQKLAQRATEKFGTVPEGDWTSNVI